MAVWFVDLELGSDANSGASWASPMLTTKAIPLPLSPGDEIRVAKSADPVLVGNATFVDGSAVVTLAAPAPGLTTIDFVSRSGEAYWGAEPWHSIATIAGTTVTLARKYRGASGAFPLYSRRPARPTPSTGVLLGFGAAGGTAFNTVDPGAASPRIVLSGGWNKATGLQDGQTFVDGQTKQGVSLRAHGFNLDAKRFSFARFGDHSLDGFVSQRGVCELDNILEGGSTGYVFGSGMNGLAYGPGTFRGNVIAGHPAHGLHIHTSWGNLVEINKLFDNNIGLSQNNDYEWQTGGTFRIGEVAWNTTCGIGGGGTIFNFAINEDWTVESLHDNGKGMSVETPGPNTFRILRAWNNGIDFDLEVNGSMFSQQYDEYGYPLPVGNPADPKYTQTFIACRLESAVGINNPFGQTMVVRDLTAQAAAPVGATVRLSGDAQLDAPVQVRVI